ncbi:uncharacterized protein PAC_10397 [Phialocephala subalpina]|uniref:Uncharacterized protein n=1 Tax=Phialocephala subalpina TaxID=576137 RepID=A0A1L7X657_9HELO|nr:uncharacterized protein PAC_10397 [Phialocephala subalpina]
MERDPSFKAQIRNPGVEEALSTVSDDEEMILTLGRGWGSTVWQSDILQNDLQLRMARRIGGTGVVLARTRSAQSVELRASCHRRLEKGFDWSREHDHGDELKQSVSDCLSKRTVKCDGVIDV